jgi:DNA-binding transcriptional LysR family regulator
MSKLPDFEGMAMFAKVAEERSFAAAAQAMGVSVATVSRAVTRLEERLGGRLFNRTSRRLALTDYGRTLAERASKIYADAEETEDFARNASSRPRGLVKLAAPLSFGARWVAPLLPEFSRRYPDIAVDLQLTDAQTDLIGDGFDAALRIAVMKDFIACRATDRGCPALCRGVAELHCPIWPSAAPPRLDRPSVPELRQSSEARHLALRSSEIRRGMLDYANRSVKGIER